MAAKHRYRQNLALSLVLLPLANALGHLPPAIGGTWVAVGKPMLDLPVLLLLFSVHMLVDSGDKYQDLPRESRPSAKLWLAWVTAFASLVLWSTYLCGFGTAIQLLRFLALELLWSTRSIPIYTPKSGFHLIKLKHVFGALKSVFSGFCSGLMDTNTITAHACALHPHLCRPSGVRMQSLAYSMLYSFVRETICDARDIVEDRQEGLTTLPIVLGPTGTMVLLSFAAVGGDLAITGGFGVDSLLRSVVTLIVSGVVVRQPRENAAAWGFLMLFGLLPAWWAQTRLL